MPCGFTWPQSIKIIMATPHNQKVTSMTQIQPSFYQHRCPHWHHFITPFLFTCLIMMTSQWFDRYPIPDSKFHGANMGATWVLPAPDGPHVGPMNLAMGDISHPPGYILSKSGARLYIPDQYVIILATWYDLSGTFCTVWCQIWPQGNGT